MKLELKDFQVAAVEDLVGEIRAAQLEVYRRAQAVSLSAPTGSGKTVIVTAAVERLVEGDHAAGPDAGATFIWLTDQPELNEQTRRKIIAHSSVFDHPRLRVVDSSFDQALFDRGAIHFLNTQKLGKDKTLVTRGDERTHTLWDTVRNTIEDRPGSLVLLIDEAHRGMTEDRNARDAAATIVQRFIKGDDLVPPVPLILGISATPRRFHALIDGTGRTSRPVSVAPEDVRESGLLKDVIRLYHPADETPSDITMLREAARALKRFDSEWASYCASANEASVPPLLVVQVRDGNQRAVSQTDLGEALRALRDELGNPPSVAFAHSFQEGAPLELDGPSVRYLAPADIDGDRDARIVFFKTSLNTGWDCPRAEVMMSFRTAKDATLIAQLVGRMVRTPLARRVEGSEFLNTVSLYLPHYDDEELKDVIDQLTKDDGENVPPADVDDGTKLVEVTGVAGSERLFDVLGRLPSYSVPRRRNTNDVNRLMKLARCLAATGVNPDAIETAVDALVDVLLEHHRKVADSPEFEALLAENGSIEVRVVTRQLSGLQEEGRMTVTASSENLNDVFEAVGRRLREGIHVAYLKRRVAAGAVPALAKLELAALCRDDLPVAEVKARANGLVQDWLKKHAAAIRKLPDRDRARINEIRALASDPQLIPMVHPRQVEVAKAPDTYKKHLYTDQRGRFPAKLTSWERTLIEREVERPDVVAWLRNPDRKPWSLCVPYRKGAERRGLYPDFLVFREESDEIVVDILDPHLHRLDDAAPKAVGLADYAAKHAHEYGRIQLIRVDKGQVRRLDLTDEATRAEVRAVTSNEHLNLVFDRAANDSE